MNTRDFILGPHLQYLSKLEMVLEMSKLGLFGTELQAIVVESAFAHRHHLTSSFPVDCYLDQFLHIGVRAVELVAPALHYIDSHHDQAGVRRFTAVLPCGMYANSGE